MPREAQSPKAEELEHGQPIPDAGGSGAVLHGGLLLRDLLEQLQTAMSDGLMEIVATYSIALNGDAEAGFPGILAVKETALSDLKEQHNGALTTMKRYRDEAIQYMQKEQAEAVRSTKPCHNAREGASEHDRMVVSTR